MMTLVIGTGGSGKSALAEKICLETGDEKRYYIATMQVLDKAGEERVARHRAMRGGKGFITIEIPMYVDEAVEKMEDPAHTTVLLECVANLVGNEMHDNKAVEVPVGMLSEEESERLADDVASEIGRLSESVHNLIVVTDRYPGEDPEYDEETRQFVRVLDLVNTRLIRMAERVKDVMNSDTEGEKM